MPKIKGRMTYKGYVSPAPGRLSHRNARTLAKVYGSCRVRNPGEIRSRKAKCARIAWSVVNKKRRRN